jgi:hypothetical protein
MKEMETMKTHALVLLTTVALGLPACMMDTENPAPEQPIDDLSQEASGNEPGTNGLDTEYLRGAKRLPLLGNVNVKNALIKNPLNKLPIEVLNVLKSETKIATGLERPNTHLLKAIVKCALLPTTATSKGQPVTFDTRKLTGWMGLHPKWYTEPCGLDCQEKVSACVIAGTNYARLIIKVDLASDASDMTRKQNPSFPIKEGAYWGNIFKDTADIQGCYALEGLDYEYTHPTASVIGGGPIPVDLMNRTCLFFAASAPYCFEGSTDSGGNQINYFTNMKKGTDLLEVQSCPSLCDITSNGNLSNCKDVAGGTTNHVFTVRRAMGSNNSGIYKKK